MADSKLQKDIDKLIRWCKQAFRCDSVRISKTVNNLYLVLGFNRNTKDDIQWQWTKNGEPYDFNYTEEKIITFGKTVQELSESCKEYHRVCNLTWEEYFNELVENYKRQREKK